MEFKQFADKVNARFLAIAASGQLFKTNVSKEVLWSTYQDTFPSELNPIFRERRVHDCQTCYSFIKKLGAVVAIIDNKIETIWDIEDLEAPYADIAKAMHTLVSNAGISSPFLTDENLAGREYNIENSASGDIKWEHFYADIDQAFISHEVATVKGSIETTVSVFKRALDEFSESALTTVIDLCDSIYRGEEFKPTVEKFLKAKQAYEVSKKDLFIWSEYKNYPAKIRNTAIGTLIIDINEGMELDDAVRKYETVVAPANYKRTSAVVTKGMEKQAIAKVDELGLRPSLPRRHAILDDISVNNVLFADSSAQAVMKDTLDDILGSIATKKTTVSSSAQEISIDKFLAEVLPNSTTVEALVENKHTPNFVSLVAPVNPEAPNMLKWNNNFSWSYAGEVTDSMKERVKAAGGKVDGVLRFSIQWNEDQQDSQNDLDAHCICPDGHIYYSNKKNRLDVDIQRPGTRTAVENITWPTMSVVRDGTYKFYVHDFSGNNKKGFRAQVEFNGQLFEYNYPTRMTKDVTVAVVTVIDGEFFIEHHLPSSASQKVEWDVTTLEYKKVSTIMLSPNFWDNQTIGNKHYFFMLEGCKNPDPVRGFYNEFLSDELRDNRKFFEILSSKMKCEPADDQLSGIGFSSTQRNELTVKVDNRPYVIKF